MYQTGPKVIVFVCSVLGNPVYEDIVYEDIGID